MIPARTDRYRREHRARHIGPRYRGWLHLAVTSLGSLTAIVVAALQVADPSPAELTIVPLAFLVANFGEYFGHRGPMHHRRGRLAVLFERHTQQHHRFYTDEAMAAESARDFQMVLFPPVMLIFFLGLLATPIGALLYLTVSANAGWLFAATGVGYFLLYEWLHFAHHQPADSILGRRRLVGTLRRLHTIHHDPRRMTRANFNITFPIADWVMGTLDRGRAPSLEQVGLIGDQQR